MPTRALVLNLAVVGLLRSLPQGVGENADRPACSAHVLNLAARHPVVNRPPAHPYDFAGLHDRERLSFDIHCCPPSKSVSVRGLQLCSPLLRGVTMLAQHAQFFTFDFPLSTFCVKVLTLSKWLNPRNICCLSRMRLRCAKRSPNAWRNKASRSRRPTQASRRSTSSRNSPSTS